MIRKLISLLLCMCLIFVLASCGDKNDPEPEKDPEPEQIEQPEEPGENEGNPEEPAEEPEVIVEVKYEAPTIIEDRRFESAFLGYGADLSTYLNNELRGSTGDVTFRFEEPFPSDYNWFVTKYYGSDPDYEYDHGPSHGNCGYIYHALETSGSYDLGGEIGDKYSGSFGIDFDIDVYVGRIVDYEKEYQITGITRSNFAEIIGNALWEQVIKQTDEDNERQGEYAYRENPDGTKHHFYYQSTVENGTVQIGDQNVAYIDYLTSDMYDYEFTEYGETKTESGLNGYDRVRYIFTFNGQFVNMLRIEVKDDYCDNDDFRSLDLNSKKNVSKDAIDELLQYFFSVQ